MKTTLTVACISLKSVWQAVFLRSALTAILLAPLAALHASNTSPNKPNVIVILADDLGWADLSCYGSTFHESPNLDKLAAQGMRFTQAYSSSPYCSPSRAAITT